MNAIRFKDRISFRLTKLCIACAFGLGVILSGTQIVFDARSESLRIDETTRHLLSMLERAAGEAAYNIDESLAQRVVDGLSKVEAVQSVQIVVLPNYELASLARPPQQSQWRWLSDFIFEPARSYEVALTEPDSDTVTGQMLVTLDTAYAGAQFLDRAFVVVVSGMVRSVVLAGVLLAIFYFSLTRPITRLANVFSHVDPQAPERTRLPIPSLHKRDEFGQWVKATNDLLAAIEENLEQRQKAEAKADFLKRYDRLTGLPNRSLFYEDLGQMLNTAQAQKRRLAIMYCDLREFQHFNDHYGFAAGDKVIQESAQRIKQVIDGTGGITARLLGDQFGIVLEYQTEVSEVAELAESLLTASREPYSVNGENVPVNMCVGIALFPEDAENVEGLTTNVEKALSIAKSSGGNQFRFYESALGEEIRHKHRIRKALETAVENDELTLYYQPQFDTRKQELVGVEALIRWTSPELGSIGPDRFIPIAEEAGLIGDIGNWVVQRACADLHQWQSEYGVMPRMAINISAAQLSDPLLPELIQQQLTTYHLSANDLEVEITETAIMDDIDAAFARLEGLRDHGIHVSVDDFGTGHSSLNYLKRLPINKLKIDQSFVRDVLTDHGDTQIVTAIINLGHSLNLSVIAEGVESSAQLSFLKERLCDEVQGYYCSPPLSPEKMQEFLSEGAVLGSAINQ